MGKMEYDMKTTTPTDTNNYYIKLLPHLLPPTNTLISLSPSIESILGSHMSEFSKEKA